MNKHNILLETVTKLTREQRGALALRDHELEEVLELRADRIYCAGLANNLWKYKALEYMGKSMLDVLEGREDLLIDLQAHTGLSDSVFSEEEILWLLKKTISAGYKVTFSKM